MEQALLFGQILAVLGTLVLLVSIYASSRAAVQPNQTSQGYLYGRVTIGPFCPVERINYTCAPSSNVYTSRKLILTFSFGSQFYLNLSGDGSFGANVNAGYYSVGLSNCTFLGCRYGLPKNVTVYAGRSTVLNISVDTGIRYAGWEKTKRMFI